MNLKFNLLAGAVLASLVSLSASGQHALVADGSIASRAPLPSHRPNQYVRVTHYTPNSSVPATSTLIATHIGGPTLNQRIARVAPVAPTPVMAVVVTPRAALASRE